MLGQYMNSVGYGAYETDSGMGFAFNGLGALPSPLLNFIFTPEKIEEGEFKGATLSRGFTIAKEGNNYFIVPKGAAELSQIASQASGSSLIGLAVGAVGNIAGELTGIRIPLPDIKQSVSQQTEVGGTVVYEPAGINPLILAGAAAGVLLVALYFMKR